MFQKIRHIADMRYSGITSESHDAIHVHTGNHENHDNHEIQSEPRKPWFLLLCDDARLTKLFVCVFASQLTFLVRSMVQWRRNPRQRACQHSIRHAQKMIKPKQPLIKTTPFRRSESPTVSRLAIFGLAVCLASSLSVTGGDETRPRIQDTQKQAHWATPTLAEELRALSN